MAEDPFHDCAGAETSALPSTVEPTVAAVSVDGDIARTTTQLRDEHRQESGPLQHAVDRITAIVGRPTFVAVLAASIIVWIGLNLLAARLGLIAPDPPPFSWLQGAGAVLALLIAALILTTQRREDQLSGKREQLVLELAVLGDQKLSKIIELVEEVRRDNPAILDRIDHEAAALSTPSDPVAVLEAIKDVQDPVS